jgi:hypothetical protein
MNAINQMSGDKATGVCGFMSPFFKKCLSTIKDDIIRVIHLFRNQHVENLHWLNSKKIALLPKKKETEEISEFRPISLIRLCRSQDHYQDPCSPTWAIHDGSSL